MASPDLKKMHRMMIEAKDSETPRVEAEACAAEIFNNIVLSDEDTGHVSEEELTSLVLPVDMCAGSRCHSPVGLTSE